MASRPARRTRVTLRCVREDLGLDVPSVEADLGSLDHPLVAEAHRIAPSARRGRKRILAIDYPLVYRLRHARCCGATWLETDAGRFRLCAGAQREEASDDDHYEHFVALNDAGRLLPDDDERLRDGLERNARIIDVGAAAIPHTVLNALAKPGRDVTVRFGDLADARSRRPRLRAPEVAGPDHRLLGSDPCGRNSHQLASALRPTRLGSLEIAS